MSYLSPAAYKKITFSTLLFQPFIEARRNFKIALFKKAHGATQNGARKSPSLLGRVKYFASGCLLSFFPINLCYFLFLRIICPEKKLNFSFNGQTWQVPMKVKVPKD